MRHYVTKESIPVNSTASAPEVKEIPVFTFNGELDVGVSGIWSPKTTIEVVNGKIAAQSTGTQNAALVLVSNNILTKNNAVMTLSLPAGETDLIFDLPHATIFTPQDQIFMASFTPSNHLEVTVTLNAIKVT